MRSSNLFLAVVGVMSVASFSQAYILIDDFTVGEYHVSLTGSGNDDHVSFGLDKSHCLAGERGTTYTVSGESFGYTTHFDVGGHEARVTTPGPRDLSTELLITYGRILPMNMDMSAEFAAAGPSGKLFEIDLGTDPDSLVAQVWKLRVIDGDGRILTNSRPGGQTGGINFRRSGFVGDDGFDWSDIDYFDFRQDWSRTGSAPLEYWATEIRAVPEPSSTAVLALTVGMVLRSRRRRLRSLNSGQSTKG